MKEQNIVDYYAQFAEHYDQVVLEGKDYTAYEEIPSWIVRVLGPRKALIADLGCGTGLSSLNFFQQGYEVVGLDVTPEMLEKARQHPFKQLLCHSVDQPLPLESRSYDAAILIGVLEFLRHPLSLFQEVHRILKEKASFGLSVPHKLPVEKERKLEIVTHAQEAIERLFNKAGFTIAHQQTFQGWQAKEETVTYQGYLLTKNAY